MLLWSLVSYVPLAGEFGKYARCDWKMPFHFRFLEEEIAAELHVSLC